jgi:hypothetical protein
MVRRLRGAGVRLSNGASGWTDVSGKGPVTVVTRRNVRHSASLGWSAAFEKRGGDLSTLLGMIWLYQSAGENPATILQIALFDYRSESVVECVVN